MSDTKSFKDLWERLKDLNGGGQGTTFLAKRKGEDEMIVVVKTLNRQKDLERRARMQREATALDTLDHPNICKIIDSNTEYYKDISYNLYIATDYIPGSTLAEFDFSGVTLSDKISLIKPILGSLKYCHDRGIIHRDIKPDNIVIKHNLLSDPIILDFGLTFNTNKNDDDNLTPSGEHLGNRFLILPEQKIGEASKRDYRSDVSCTVGLLFYIITNLNPVILIDENGRKPHQREEAKAIIDNLPEHQRIMLNSIFDIGFESQIDRRWQSIQSLIDQIEILENSTVDDRSSIDKYLADIKRLKDAPGYQDAAALTQLYAEIDKVTRSALNELYSELGEDWATVQSGGPMWQGNQLVYKNMLAPYSQLHNYQGKNVIYAFQTGNELVIQILEKRDAPVGKEVFRQPIVGQKDWSGFTQGLKAYYLEGIHKKLF